jgi:hypothetical protein
VICTHIRERIRDDIAGESEQRECGKKPQKYSARENAHRENE